MTRRITHDGLPERREGLPERKAQETDSSLPDVLFEGKTEYELDVDRMVNEGLGGGRVTIHNGYIGDATTDRPGGDSALTDGGEDPQA